MAKHWFIDSIFSNIGSSKMISESAELNGPKIMLLLSNDVTPVAIT